MRTDAGQFVTPGSQLSPSVYPTADDGSARGTDRATGARGTGSWSVSVRELYYRRMAECAPSQEPAPVGNASGRTVQCVKFQKQLPGLDSPPWPGELGQRIFDNVSAQAWKLWEERMKMILNEYRLMPWQKEAQELIGKQMEDFFFGEAAALPPGYVPQQTK